MENTNWQVHLAAPDKPLYLPPAPPRRLVEAKKPHLLVRIIRWLVTPKLKYLGEWVYSERDNVWRFHVPVWG